MKLRLDDIVKDKAKIEMYLDGFLHGTSGLSKRKPTYEINSYELGYKDGSTGKLERYFKVSEADGPAKEKLPLTRKK